MNQKKDMNMNVDAGSPSMQLAYSMFGDKHQSLLKLLIFQSTLVVKDI